MTQMAYAGGIRGLGGFPKPPRTGKIVVEK